MMTQAQLDEMDNEAELMFGTWLNEFEMQWQFRPKNEVPIELDEQTLALLMEADDDGSDLGE